MRFDLLLPEVQDRVVKRYHWFRSIGLNLTESIRLAIKGENYSDELAAQPDSQDDEDRPRLSSPRTSGHNRRK